jgi:prevent-host-death family protein
MSREVTVDELRDQLDDILDAVERGESVSIRRNGRNIAALQPAPGRLGVRYPFRDFDFGSRPKGLKTDVVDLIREDR